MKHDETHHVRPRSKEVRRDFNVKELVRFKKFPPRRQLSAVTHNKLTVSIDPADLAFSSSTVAVGFRDEL
jgi:hypothetical protein